MPLINAVEGQPDAPVVETGLTGAVDKLFGLNGQQRYQTWPEKMVREAMTAPGDAMSQGLPMPGLRREDFTNAPADNVPQTAIGRLLGVGPVAWSPQDNAIEKAQAVSALAGTGVLAAEKGALGSAGGALIQPAKKAPTFYSAVEKQVADSGQAKASGDQWLSTLGNKPGVKPEELQWTGLDEFLKGKKSVTKEEIQSHLNNNKIELGEVVKGVENPELLKLKAARDYAEQHGTFDEGMAANQAYIKAGGQSNPTKYSQYQVPGGENYREVLMTLPDAKPTQRLNAIESELANIKARKPRNSTEFATPEDTEAFYRLSKEARDLATKNPSEGNYKSSHWDEPNILAHMRMNDRTIDGKKSLHLEEVQSDWHQDGRKNGYKNDAEKVSRDLALGIADKIKTGANPENITATEVLKAFKSKKITEKEQDDLLAWQSRYAGYDGRVPDAPFKKNWHELALKRAIAEAAENGYDKLSWTAGEHHPTNPKNLNQTGPEADAADKGMQGFYNNMLPKTVEKLTGQKVQTTNLKAPPTYEIKNPVHNARGQEIVSVYEDGKFLADMEKSEAAHYVENRKTSKQGIKAYHIDIPQELRDKIVGKGQPLFSAPPVLVPVSHDPFKTTPVNYNPFENPDAS